MSAYVLYYRVVDLTMTVSLLETEHESADPILPTDRDSEETGRYKNAVIRGRVLERTCVSPWLKLYCDRKGMQYSSIMAFFTNFPPSRFEVQHVEASGAPPRWWPRYSAADPQVAGSNPAAAAAAFPMEAGNRALIWVHVKEPQVVEISRALNYGVSIVVWMFGQYKEDLGAFAKSEALRLKTLEKLRKKEEKLDQKELKPYRPEWQRKCFGQYAHLSLLNLGIRAAPAASERVAVAGGPTRRHPRYEGPRRIKWNARRRSVTRVHGLRFAATGGEATPVAAFIRFGFRCNPPAHFDAHARARACEGAAQRYNITRVRGRAQPTKRDSRRCRLTDTHRCPPGYRIRTRCLRWVDTLTVGDRRPPS
ncbi:hypothetical protein HPB51_005322 [Rhipicephalus microplus]|uniref:Uncharacterized protein n=1 Tax=Rhipicephalus microplus TaxID=6941 RepID=A0A9J6EXN4_RHIMP|nr:hypothetical protein HPB51_005322 [Rhipicephalus microplus]